MLLWTRRQRPWQDDIKLAQFRQSSPLVSVFLHFLLDTTEKLSIFTVFIRIT